MNELILKLFPTLTSALFSIGGTGYKWLRRFGIPIACFLLTHSIIISVLLCIGLHLPYGDSLNKLGKWAWLTRMLIISTYYMPFLLLGFNMWCFISLAVSICLFRASNTAWGSKLCPWWVVEPIMGFLIGITATTSI